MDFRREEFKTRRPEGRHSVIRQPPLRSVREHFWNVAYLDLALNGAPEIGPKNLAVMLKKGGQGWLWESQELQISYREVSFFTLETARFCSNLFTSGVRASGSFAKIAMRQETKLIVIVKDDAAVTGHAKIFREQVPRKDVGGGKVLDRLSIVASGGRACLWLGFPEKKLSGRRRRST